MSAYRCLIEFHGVLARRKRIYIESMNLRTHAISPSIAISKEKTVTGITHKAIRYWRVRFHRQPFSKQLYLYERYNHLISHSIN